MDIVIIASLIIAGLILFIIEVFLLPGVSIAGIVSAGCLLYANYQNPTHFPFRGRMSTQTQREQRRPYGLFCPSAFLAPSLPLVSLVSLFLLDFASK